ncbi:MAG: NTP transferase domain-containing protein [Candidatus Neomarinimicrobiota bacterium]
MKISATVLAAGKSIRMGSKNKLLLDYRGVPMIRHICKTVISASFNPIKVITGFEKEKIESVLSDLNLSMVNNNKWHNGISSSIAIGISSLLDGTDGNMIVLGDMPLISEKVLNKLSNTFKLENAKKIVYPLYAGQQANPVIFPKKYFPDIISNKSDLGCKKIIERYKFNALGIDIKSNEVIVDCDEEEDYLKLIKQTG